MKRLLVFVVLSLIIIPASYGKPNATANKYRSVLVREAQLVQGLEAPIPMYAAQIEQESGWRPGVTAWDNGRGLAQFMDATTDTVTRLYPELGKGDPYDPVWAIRAMVRYDKWIYNRVKGVDECQRFAAVLKSYNAGLGYVQQQQRVSPDPQVWFDVTEHIPTKQSATNQHYSRMYPRWILFKRQPTYAGWGKLLCQDLEVKTQ